MYGVDLRCYIVTSIVLFKYPRKIFIFPKYNAFTSESNEINCLYREVSKVSVLNSCNTGQMSQTKPA